ncbi:DHH family phosphoesterase, partial [Klebsiella pneumoniae]
TALLDERRKLERELTEARKQLALGGSGNGAAQSETVNGVGFIGKVVTGVNPRDLKPLADDAKKTVGSGIVTFIGVSEDGKASAVVGVTDDLV